MIAALVTLVVGFLILEIGQKLAVKKGKGLNPNRHFVARLVVLELAVLASMAGM